jgi:hypothetical protein
VRLRKDRETVRNESGRTVAERPALTISTADQLPQDAPHLHEGMPMTFADLGFVARRALPYAAGLVALTVAAGCTSGSPTPSASTAVPPMATSSTVASMPPSTSATPKPSVDPVVAKIPAAARPETKTGAVAFAKYFLSQVNTAFVRAEPSALDDLFEASCTACVQFREGAQALKQDGLRHKGVSVATTRARLDEYSASKRTVALGVVQNSVPVVTSDGKKVRSTQAGSGTFLATLQFHGHWTVTNLQVVK